VYKDKKNAYWNSCKCVYWTTISHEYDVNKMMKEKKKWKELKSFYFYCTID